MKISLRSRTSWQQRARPQKEKTTDKYVCAYVHFKHTSRQTGNIKVSTTFKVACR